MPKADVQGIQLYYEIHGSGSPVILIRGLGSNADHWYCQVPVFSVHHSVVVFDNRGIGRSDIPDAPFTISDMARDTVLLMDALGIAKAHILGISMGGMIAQEIARSHGQRVDGLILGCTHCGGAHTVQTSPAVLEELSESLFAGTQEAIQKGTRLLFSDRTLQQHPDVVRRYREVSMRFPPPVQTLRHQIEAIQGHDAWDDLIRIQNPTLILTGNEDLLIPPENSTILAERIPRAQLRVIEGVGHQLFIEEPEACNRAVLEFLGSRHT